MGVRLFATEPPDASGAGDARDRAFTFDFAFALAVRAPFLSLGAVAAFIAFMGRAARGGDVGGSTRNSTWLSTCVYQSQPVVYMS